MNLFRLAYSIGGLGLLATSLSACLKAPEYSTTPSISFNDIQDIRIQPKQAGGQPLDSIRMTINYQDGDGDLGLTSDERKNPPYDYQKGANKFYNNFFVEPFVRNTVTGKYESVVSKGLTTAGAYNGAFPHPTTTTDSKAAPIKGTLTYAPIAFGLGDIFQPRDSVRFEISIADRALHVSNTITTRSVYILPR
ncbi:hypothetical protein GKZ68_02580 [Hymenobacter sp. BRD128]|uniref:hypothetical protein n=1 Tax=Hymenobacter sp. BRD128 TaxID=2675878 RepID=UPI0015674740|nr:hypothetical protein [Hymenobacter sp. BRD128]QKG55620.1 hypothetical protein GKZ68_02580 [Hymenobacter sp. BRD128]